MSGDLYPPPIDIRSLMQAIGDDTPSTATPTVSQDEAAMLRAEISRLKAELQSLRLRQFEAMSVERQSDLGQFATDYHRALTGAANDTDLEQFANGFFSRNSLPSLY